MSLAACRRVLLAMVSLGALIAAAPAAADWTAPAEISDAGTRNAGNLQVDAGPGRVAAWTYGAPGVAVVLPTAGGAPAPQTFPGSYGPPTVGIGGSGVGAIAFQASPYGIFAASKPAGASAFGAAAQIEGPPNETGMVNPILAVNAQGTAQLFHGIEDQTYGFGSKYTGRILSDPSTNTWTAGGAFGTGEPFTHNAAVATATDGSTALLLKSENGLNFREVIPAVIENDGSVAAGAAIVASSGNGSGALTNPSGISLARLPDASLAAAFQLKAGTNGGIFVSDLSKSRAGGTGGGIVPRVRVSDDEDGSQPHIATDAAGDTIVTWYDPSDGAGDPSAIRARFRAAGSTTWNPTETVAAGNLDEHALAVDGLGNAFVVYVDQEADEIATKVRTPGASGTWGAAETISSGLSGVQEPRVAVPGDYEAFAAFTADNGLGSPARAVYSASGDAHPVPPGGGGEEPGGGGPGGGDPGGGSPGGEAPGGGNPGGGGPGSGIPGGEVPAGDPGQPGAGGGDPNGGAAGGAAPAAGAPGGGTETSGGTPSAGGQASTCKKASKRLHKANTRVKKAKKQVRKAKARLKKARNHAQRAKKRAQKAKAAKRVKHLRRASKKAKRAKVEACR